MTGRALITGASSGIGAALARRLALRGYEVWLAARRLPELESEARAIESEGGRARAVAIDVSKPERAGDAVAALDREIGGFDLLVANAGVGGPQKPVAQQTLSAFREVIEINLMGAVATILAVVPGMVERGRGHIVGVSSLAAECPLPAGADYGTSKAALSFFLASAASDLIPRGVWVTDVHPGFVKTPLTAKNKFPMPFLVELDEAARIIDRGIERKKRVVRFPGPLTAAITGGNLLPVAWRDALINRNRPI
jgi:short-subunit dehydrogenase